MCERIVSRCYQLLGARRTFTTSTCKQLNQTWRKSRGLPLNPNACGPLTDLPDYSYADGRPVPLGPNKKKRILKHAEITQRIITLSKEMDYALERHQQTLQAKDDEKQKILDNKLKPKGHLLLKDGHSM